MHRVDVWVFPARPDVSEIVAFVEAVTDIDGTRPLSDHLWLDVQRGGSEGFIAVRIGDEAGTLAIAQISAAHQESTLEVVVHPRADHSGPGAARVARDAAETAIDAFQRSGGGTLAVWVDDNPVGSALAAVCGEHGLSVHRTLHEMRAALPLLQQATITTRAFAPGVDDAGWVEVNNRAFANHGEQGGWTLETLALRRNEPWFNADGFRIHDMDGRIAAFCWTKVHGLELPVEDQQGEIYVIAVDPEFHGRGLGRELTLAGLDSIAERGITAANLYVDGDNAAAVGLYRSLGFTVHRTRRAFGGNLNSPHREQP